MSEQHVSCGAKPLLVLKTSMPLSKDQTDALRPVVDELGRRVGAEVIVLSEGMDLSVMPSGLELVVAVIKEQAQSNSELAAAIRRQADAIADLAEAVTAQQDDGDEPDGLGHLGAL